MLVKSKQLAAVHSYLLLRPLRTGFCGQRTKKHQEETATLP